MNKKGFTLIELLAVIIILGILMIIAIPSVTKYINDSRKSSYIDTAKELVSGARNLVNDGKLEMYDTDATYYIDVACIKTENGGKAVSPYGDFVKEKAYVVVTFDGKGYDYYWTSIDDSGQGVKNLIKYDKLDIDNIESDLKTDDIKTDRGIDGRKYVILITERNNCKKEGSTTAETQINGETGEEVKPVCIPATTLHEVECKATYTGCYYGGYRDDNKMIKYGTIPTGTPKPGDAYDCDVNYDGTYDDQDERFYYVGSEGNNSVLIFYRNINYQDSNEYDSVYENWHGPRIGYQYLPSTSDWDNPGIIPPGTRQIVNENGGTSTAGGPIAIFTYTDRAARLLTAQELINACPSLSTMGHVEGELDGCNWFLEKIGRYENYNDANAGIYGYWLETPRSDVSNSIHDIWGNKRRTYSNGSSDPNLGIRPVITVKTSSIEQ